MARKAPEDLNDAIWVLMKQELSAPVIAQRIREGDAGLKAGPIQIGLRTVQRRMQRLRRDRGEILPAPDEPVTTTADAVAQELLGYARRQIRLAPRARFAKQWEVQTLERLGKIVAALQAPAPSQAPKRRGEAKKRSTDPPNLLAELRRAHEEGIEAPASISKARSQSTTNRDNATTRDRYHASASAPETTHAQYAETTHAQARDDETTSTREHEHDDDDERSTQRSY